MWIVSTWIEIIKDDLKHLPYNLQTNTEMKIYP